jgi:hypothetical protein
MVIVVCYVHLCIIVTNGTNVDIFVNLRVLVLAHIVSVMQKHS